MTDTEAQSQAIRSAILAAWSRLPVEQRSARQQAMAFAQRTARIKPFAGSAAQTLQILGWLLPTLPRVDRLAGDHARPGASTEANQPA